MLDDIYSSAIKAGAIGGKLLGAGGGGFFVFYVPDGRKDNVKKELRDLLYVPFEFENIGTEIIHYSPEDYSKTK